MSPPVQSVQAHFDLANAGWRNFNGSMMEFQGALQRGDWAAAEVARNRAVAGLESYLDGLAALHRVTP